MASRISAVGSQADSQPKVTDLESFLPWACKEFTIEANVIVTRATQEAYVRVGASTKKGMSTRKISTAQPGKPTDDLDSEDDSKWNSKTAIELENVVSIKTLYDCHGQLVQIMFLQNKTIPRRIMQILGLAVPYHKQLTSITINSGLRIDAFYEMAKFLPHSNITELCLDDTFFTAANYHILLTHGKLKHLSLARCSINDVVVKTITDQLKAESPASRVLSALNLSSNRITDVGAKYVAGMLRTNRQLSYLNLAGNMITDEGGMSILSTLQKFPLGSQECVESRDRYMAYLKKRHELIEKLKPSLQTASARFSRKKSMRKSDATYIREKAEDLAATEMEPYNDPFSPDNTESEDGVVRCFGNNTLCCLNLAYNNLTYISVRKLLEVLLTQKSLNRTPKGLIKVMIEGNLMPVVCKEYEEINSCFRDSSVKTKPAKTSAKM